MTETKKQSSPLPAKKRNFAAPAPVTLQGMSFREAITQIIDGKKVARTSWPDPKEHCCIKDEYLMIHRPDGVYYKWIVAEADMRALDWKIVS